MPMDVFLDKNTVKQHTESMQHKKA